MREISGAEASWLTMCTRYQKAPLKLWKKCFKHLKDPWCQEVAMAQRDGGSTNPKVQQAVDNLNQWWAYCQRFHRK